MASTGSRSLLLLRRAMATAAPAAVAVVKKPGAGKPKKKNLLDVARLLPGWGVGCKVAKSHWQPQTYYKIQDIKLYKDAGHGIAWGIYHERGIEAGKLQKIGGANKRCWKHIEDEPSQPWKSLAPQKTPAENQTEVPA